MIFVTVGSSSWKFNRLISEIDRIAGLLDEEVVMQIGPSDVPIHNSRTFRYLSPDEMDSFISQARIIVSHAGAGTILKALKAGKRIVVVPRQGWSEAYDNHQTELAEVLGREGVVRVIFHLEALESEIRSGDSSRVAGNSSNASLLVSRLRAYILALRESSV